MYNQKRQHQKVAQCQQTSLHHLRESSQSMMYNQTRQYHTNQHQTKVAQRQQTSLHHLRGSSYM